MLQQEHQEYFISANIEFPEDRVPRRLASISVVARLQVVSDAVQTATAPTELRATASDSIAVRHPASP